MAAEFDLVARIRAHAASGPRRDDVVLGIGDDAALLSPPAGMQLVVAMDTLNAGVHFPDDTAPADIGWKALAVNLSDLAAMGAAPAWCTLSLSLPAADAAWIDAFLDGFAALAGRHDVVLVGGDTTRGPLSVCITAHGLVPPAQALRRDGARPGDGVWLTGTVGEAAAALAQWRDGPGRDTSSGAIDASFRERLDRPTPRIDVGLRLRGVATACIDVSDGVVADLGHVCTASGVAADLAVDALPWTELLRTRFDTATRRALQSGGGDDYELCFTAPPAAAPDIAAIAEATGVQIVRVGTVVEPDGEGGDVRCFDADGVAWQAPVSGHEHFAGG